nr:TRAP transporter substrate-binding protein [Parvularcula maris]
MAGCGETERPLWAADAQPANYPTVEALRHFAATLEKLTGDELRIKIYPGAQLGPERDTLEMTIFGGLDINRVNTAPLNPIAEETIVPALPFVFSSIRHMRACMDGEPGRHILEALEPAGLKGLCFYDSGARSFYNSRRPVLEPSDLQGLKIRVQNSDLYVATMKALGASATPMSFSEVYQALVQKVIDGAENNWPSYESTRHFEAAPFYSLTQHIMAPEVLVMSMRRWRLLTDDQRAAVLEAARQSVPVMRRIWDARVETSRKIVLGAGVTVNDISDKSLFRSKVQPVYERFINRKLIPLVELIGDTAVPLG